MNESQKDKIQKEAKQILKNFAESLSNIKIKRKKYKESSGGFREEGLGESASQEFRKQMFKNAPDSEGDFIIAEKKKW